MKLGNVSTAIVTPFNSEDEIAYDVLESLIEHLISTGTDSVVVSGTTGESPTLTANEKKNLIQFVVQHVNGRIPVIAGTGSNSTKASIEATKQAEQLGVDGIMLVAPYYNKPDQEGLIAHMKTVANETTLPVMLYNIPGRSAVNMTSKTIAELSSIPNITAVKEASGNLDQMTEILAAVPEDFYVYSGDDSLTLPLLACGGHGIVSVASHIVGTDLQTMIQAFHKGNHSLAAHIHQQLLPLVKALFMKPNPVPVKFLLKEVGINTGHVRLPLVSMSNEDEKIIRNIWNNFQENRQQWNS